MHNRHNALCHQFYADYFISRLSNILIVAFAAIVVEFVHPKEFLDVDVDLDDTQISDDTAIVLYRVTQEAFNNIMKHSDAKKASLQLSSQGETICFRVKDNGIGFNIGDGQQKTKDVKMGIQGMRERIESLGGTFVISAAPKKGAEISVTLPYL